MYHFRSVVVVKMFVYIHEDGTLRDHNENIVAKTKIVEWETVDIEGNVSITYETVLDDYDLNDFSFECKNESTNKDMIHLNESEGSTQTQIPKKRGRPKKEIDMKRKKRAVTDYNIFVKKNIEELKSTHQNLTSNDLLKIAAKLWKESQGI